MKSLVWLCALVFVVASRNEQVPLDESGKKGRLEIAVFDAFGEAIPTPRVIIQGTGTGQPAITISYTNAVELDYGTYTITAEQSGYGRAKVDTTLSNPYTVLVLGMAPADIENSGSPSVLRGRLATANLCVGCRMIRLVPLLLRAQPTEALVSESGQFQFENVKPGLYACTLFNARGICGVFRATVLLRQFQ